MVCASMYHVMHHLFARAGCFATRSCKNHPILHKVLQGAFSRRRQAGPTLASYPARALTSRKRVRRVAADIRIGCRLRLLWVHRCAYCAVPFRVTLPACLTFHYCTGSMGDVSVGSFAGGFHRSEMLSPQFQFLSRSWRGGLVIGDDVENVESNMWYQILSRP